MKPFDSVWVIYMSFYLPNINSYNINPGKDLNDQLVRFPYFTDRKLKLEKLNDLTS